MIDDKRLNRYERITDQLRGLIEGQSPNLLAAMATICAVLHAKMPHHFWTGFYFVADEDTLHVGPYQGPVACQVLKGQGVCLHCVRTKQPVVVADVGTAVTIDLVDQNGVFQGGVIYPGLEMGARALKEGTAQLPKAKVSRPKGPYGKNTAEAIKCGLYYSAVATVQEVIRRYAEKLGKWPQTILTGSAAKTIKEDCDFIDSYVPNLVVKGIVLAYQKYIEEKME